jgi:hypothetical protein
MAQGISFNKADRDIEQGEELLIDYIEIVTNEEKRKDILE